MGCVGDVGTWGYVGVPFKRTSVVEGSQAFVETFRASLKEVSKPALFLASKRKNLGHEYLIRLVSRIGVAFHT